MTRSSQTASRLLAVAAAAALLACGGDDNNDNNDNTPKTTTVNGYASVFPPAAAVLTAAAGGTAYDPGDLSQLRVTLVSAAAQLAGLPDVLGNSPQPLEEVTGSNYDTTWSVADVDFTKATLAIIAHIDDPRTTGAIQSHRVTTGILADTDYPTDNPATFSIGGPTDKGAPAFIVPAAFEQALAADLGLDPAAMVAAGYILGVVVDASGNPVSGATVTTSPSRTVAYPNFATGDATSTGATGVFVVTGAATTTPLDITATKSGTTFTPARGGIQANITYVVPVTGQ